MNWFIVDKEYVNYLSQFDEKVGFVEYGNRIKLHVGMMLEML
jgi:protein AbiQ